MTGFMPGRAFSILVLRNEYFPLRGPHNGLRRLLHCLHKPHHTSSWLRCRGLKRLAAPTSLSHSSGYSLTICAERKRSDQVLDPVSLGKEQSVWLHYLMNLLGLRCFNTQSSSFTYPCQPGHRWVGLAHMQKVFEGMLARPNHHVFSEDSAAIGTSWLHINTTDATTTQNLSEKANWDSYKDREEVSFARFGLLVAVLQKLSAPQVKDGFLDWQGLNVMPTLAGASILMTSFQFRNEMDNGPDGTSAEHPPTGQQTHHEKH